MMALNPVSLRLLASAYLDELEETMKDIIAPKPDTPDFPALVELAQRLEGKDRKTCELALYTLKKQDERLAKKDVRIASLKAALDDAMTALIKSRISDPDVQDAILRMTGYQ